MDNQAAGVKRHEAVGEREYGVNQTMDDDPKLLGWPLLFGFFGLMISWLILGFFISALILAIVSIAIGIVSFGLGYLVMTLKER